MRALRWLHWTRTPQMPLLLLLSVVGCADVKLDARGEPPVMTTEPSPGPSRAPGAPRVQRARGEEGVMGNGAAPVIADGLLSLYDEEKAPHPAKVRRRAPAQPSGGKLKDKIGPSALAELFGDDLSGVESGKKASEEKASEEQQKETGAASGAKIGAASGFGGLGLSGVGLGGGGVHEGIGIGNIGVAGRGGAGYGRGPARLGERSATAPKIRAGRAEVRGALDKAVFQRVIRQHRNEYRYCYERALMKQRGLNGKITVKFVITANGDVATAQIPHSTLNSAEVEACIVNRVRRWRFPAPKGGGVVVVNYPFVFESNQPRLADAEPVDEPETSRAALKPPTEAAQGRYVKPDKLLPRVFYFENTYLGGNAAYAERLRRLDQGFNALSWARPYRLAQLQVQALDDPMDAGLALHAQLDQPYLDQPSRVILQVGLQGSQRYGWRRPPLDLLLLVDLSDDGQAEQLTRAAKALLKQLGPQDRLGITLSGAPPQRLSPLSATDDLRGRLARSLEAPRPAPSQQGFALALADAERQLQAAADPGARVPGSQILLMLVRGDDGTRATLAEAAARRLGLQGVVTSVIDLAPAPKSAWWRVADAGHGNLHGAEGGRAVEALIEAELSSFSKVIARLLRLNIRLEPGVEAIQVIGSRVLEAKEVTAVKAREVATDRSLSISMGVEADRGEDSDGIQTVIPYFYGGDTHVILVELWVERPGAVADVSVEFKDMVRLRNAQAHTRVSLSPLPRPRAQAQRVVARNRGGFQLAEALRRAAEDVTQGSPASARRRLAAAAAWGQGEADRALLRGFEALLEAAERDDQDARLLSEALEVSSCLRIGASTPL
ncbi:TonB family protein [Myxococcota bacterium]|nr:TonB family protein [Myxococcota bacterium]